MYNVHFFAQISEGKIRMCIIHGYNNRYNNPMYNVHKNVGTHYTQQNTVFLISSLSESSTPASLDVATPLSAIPASRLAFLPSTINSAARMMRIQVSPLLKTPSGSPST